MNKNQPSEELVSTIVETIHQQFKKLSRNYYLAPAGIFVGIFLLGLAAVGLLENSLYLSPTVKFTVLGFLFAGSVATSFYSYRSTNSISFKSFYHRFGRWAAIPELSDALDLHFDTASDAPLKRAAIKQNISALDHQSIQNKLSKFSKQHPIQKNYYISVAIVLTAFIFLSGITLINPAPIERLAQPWKQFTPPNPYNYTVEPGNLVIEQGNSFSPSIHFEDQIPQQLTLAFKTNIEENFRERTPNIVDNNKATFKPVKLSTDGRYFMKMDGFESETFEIDVQLRPRFEKLTLMVTPPDYTRLDTTFYDYPFSKIRAYRGSAIKITGVTNKPIRHLLYRSTTLQDTLDPSENSAAKHHFQTTHPVTNTDTISFSMHDSAGLTNNNSFRFILVPRKDQHPVVNILEPTKSIEMRKANKLNLKYEASDDFGITSASLHYELKRAFTSEPEKGAKEITTPKINEEQNVSWNLPALKPKARDVITYWIEVYDNDQYSGAKSSRSQKMSIIFPSLTEYMDELQNKERDVTESLNKLSESFGRMQDKYNEFKDKLKQNPKTNWEQQQELKEVDRERKKMDKEVEKLNRKFEEIRNEIKENRVMSPETIKAYDELQKLIKEINDPELQKALEELQNSLGDLNPEQMRKALQNYEFNEEQYKQRLNRTVELFKALKLNSNLEKYAKSLEELSVQEQKISKSDQATRKEAEQQQAIQKDLSDLQEQLKKLSSDAPDKAKKQVEELQQITDRQLDHIQKKLKENINRLKQQAPYEKDSETQIQQRYIQKQLEKTARQIRDAKQQLNQQRRNINMAALEYVLYSLLNLSKNQEDLTKETGTLPPRSQAFVEKARLEQNISSQFTILSDSLFIISSEIPSFSNQINKKKTEVKNQLSRAVNLLAERNRSNATYAQRQSLGGINELSTMIASLIDQLNNQQGGSGGAMSMQQLMEQLQKMSGKQQQLNQQIQDMINDIQGNRLSQDQMDRLNQMSKQQNRIRKQIKKLQRRGGLGPGDRVLSELERMNEQMEDTINDLRGGQVDRNMMKRQENILSRMLNAEKAVQERGKEDRREATTVKEVQQAVPPDVTLEELQQKIRKMLNDPDRTKFTDDYQRLIKQYFELLKKQDKEIIQ